MLCENSSTMASGVIAPQCFANKAVVKITVEYNEVESDTLRLCKECAGYLTKDAKSHGYNVKEVKI